MISPLVASALPVTLSGWRAHQNKSLRGFATVQVGALRIIDVAVFARDSGRWCCLPAKPMLNKNGHARRTPDGRIYYANVLEWNSMQAERQFSQDVFDALERDYPDALILP